MADDRASELAKLLEDTAEQALRWCGDVLSRPVNEENGSLLRAQGSAVQSVLATQIKADAMRLKAARADKALDELLKLMREKQQIVPSNQDLVVRENLTNTLGLLANH